jgi:glycosyltransferase involved in cell wall biosynthesis
MQNRGRILILVENLPVPFDRRVWLEATTLHRAGYTVSVICPAGGRHAPGYELLDGIHVHRYKLRETGTGFFSYVREYAAAMVKTLWLSFKVARRPGFDVLHACNPPDLFFLIAWLYKPFGKKFVFDQHDLSPETYRVQRNGREGLIYNALLFLEKLTYATADVVIATNESIRSFAHGRGGVDDERIFTVRTGPDFQRMRIVPADTKLKRGAKFLVCYLGVMGRQDGVDYALRAAAAVVRRRDDVKFTFIGSGDMIEELKQLAGELRLNGHVHFTGRVSDEDLVKYLSTADVCISPDPQNGLNEFHTMNKTLEYMAMGKPQVAFDLAEMRVSAADAAVYARPNDVEDFADRLIDLLHDPGRRLAMGRSARRRIEEQLGWEHTHVSLLEAYARLFSPQAEPFAESAAHQPVSLAG